MNPTVWFLTSNQGKLAEAAHHFANIGIAVQALEVQKQLSKSSLNFKSVHVKAYYAADSESCGTFDSM